MRPLHITILAALNQTIVFLDLFVLLGEDCFLI